MFSLFGVVLCGWCVVPLLLEDEERAGDICVFGPGRAPGLVYVDGLRTLLDSEGHLDLGTLTENTNLLSGM